MYCLPMQRFLRKTFPLVLLLWLGAATVYSIGHFLGLATGMTYLATGSIPGWVGLASNFAYALPFVLLLILPVHLLLKTKEEGGSVARVSFWTSVVILFLAAFLTILLLTQFAATNPQGEAGMGYALILIAAGVATGVLMFFFGLTAVLITRFALSTLLKVLGIFGVVGLALPYAISFLVTGTFCTLVDGRCIGRVAAERNNMSACANAFDKYDCYAEYAVIAKDRSACQKTVSVDACNREYAVQWKQPEVCLETAEANWRAFCCGLVFGYPSSDYSQITDEQAGLCNIREYLRDQRERYGD